MLLLPGCSDGDDGKQGPPGPTVINASQVSDEFLASLGVESEIVKVKFGGKPRVTFKLESDTGVPITGIVPFWEDDSRYVRFTLAKLVPAIPDAWVSYTRDPVSNDPDYDTGSSLVDHGDGTYTFTYNTDISKVTGVAYEPGLTHRVAGQIGSSAISLAAQNLFLDVVPNGKAVTLTRNIAVMDSCNECHDDLVFHGRRFKVEYCVTCHNADLAMGEGNMAYMIHRIHNSGDFMFLDGGASFAEVTYPQDVKNCRKCHNGADVATPDADNWMNVPSVEACFGCHTPADHPGGQPPPDNSVCTICHTTAVVEADHATANMTPNNPSLFAGQVSIVYDLMDASVGGANEVTVNLRILSDGNPIDVANLPADLAGPGRYPGLLLAWALPQDGIAEPMDYNNFGQRAAQAMSVSLGDFFGGGTAGTHSYDGGTGVNTFVITDAARQFPMNATLRAVGMEGYFQQDIMGTIVSLHTPSAVVPVTGDDARRMVVDSAKCAECHEWFEGHGGNRTYNIQVCTLCHVPNLSSTGRTVTDPTLRNLDQQLIAAITAGTLSASVDPNDPLTYPEDAQNLKDLVHGIHSSGFRERAFQHVRGPNRQDYYDWSEVTFPHSASTSTCTLCHEGDSFTLPLPDDILPATVRTTDELDGQDTSNMQVEGAFTGVPNTTDWVNSITAGACVGCHTDQAAMGHMELNGGQLSLPNSLTWWTNRSSLGSVETCVVCHGPGSVADIEVVHDL